jgi:dipeptide/tripeptide permease
MTTSMSLYLHHHVNRTFGSFEMPTVWLNALGSLIVTATAAISSREHKKNTFTELRTISRGLAWTALAFFILFITVSLALASDFGTILAFLVAYILLCIADLVIRPQLFTAVSTYFPPQKGGLMIGLVYLVIGVGVKLGGCLAATVGTCGYAFLFGSLTLASSTICLSLLAFDKKSRAQAIFSRKALQQSNQEETSPL